jgi:hypothetical protein
MALLAAVSILAVPSHADENKDMTIDIEGEDGQNISLTISSNLVDGIIEGLSENDMQCDTTTDKETLAMLQHLDRKGEGSKYSFTNDEGEVVKARRRKGQWEMEVVKEDANNTIISMPWGVGECMLGRDVPAYKGRDELEFKIEQDGGLRIRIE